MAKKENTTLLIVGALAVVGYFAFRSGGFLSPVSTQRDPLTGALLPKGQTPTPAPMPQLSNPNDIGIVDTMPNINDLGIYVPQVDPTGMSIQLF